MVSTPPNRGEPLQYTLAFTFKSTNNEAEYESLLTTLRLTLGISVDTLRVKCDSRLVVKQV